MSDAGGGGSASIPGEPTTSINPSKTPLLRLSQPKDGESVTTHVVEADAQGLPTGSIRYDEVVVPRRVKS